MKSAGVSSNVINAALKAATPKTTPGNPTGGEIVDGIGAYVLLKDVPTVLPVEVVNFKTSGMLGAVVTYGIKKAKFQGTVPGAKSSTQIASPIVFILQCADGTDAWTQFRTERFFACEAATHRGVEPEPPAARRDVRSAVFESGKLQTGRTKQRQSAGAVAGARPQATHVFHQYVIRAQRRDELRKFLADRNIE